MDVERIHTRLKSGFRPFSIVTSSGEKYAVPHSEFILLTSRTVVVGESRGYAVLLNPLHIVGLEDIKPSANGKSKRKRRLG